MVVSYEEVKVHARKAYYHANNQNFDAAHREVLLMIEAGASAHDVSETFVRFLSPEEVAGMKAAGKKAKGGN